MPIDFDTIYKSPLSSSGKMAKEQAYACEKAGFAEAQSRNNTPQMEIPERIGRLQQAVALNAKLSHEVADRLAPVIRSSPPSPQTSEGAGEARREPQTELGRAMCDIEAQIDLGSFVLRSILDRLQI